MPRSSRTKSTTDVYHVILRGINRQDIFLDDQDYQKFLKELQFTKEKYNYKVYAYILMTNHIHLLIYTPNNVLSKAIQSLTIRYSLYFNKKYERCGHLFQNRFLSKNVDSESYLLHLQRYIHQNSIKGKIEHMEKYKWSSYKEYTVKRKIVDTTFILNLFSDEINKAIELFKKFNSSTIEKDKLEFEMQNYYSDEEIIAILKEENIINIQKYNKEIRDKLIKKALKIKGTNANQIARVLGINKRLIYRIGKA